MCVHEHLHISVFNTSYRIKLMMILPMDAEKALNRIQCGALSTCMRLCPRFPLYLLVSWSAPHRHPHRP